MKSEMDKMMNRNSGRFGAIKNLVASLKLHIIHSPRINGNTEVPVYWTSRDYRAHVIETEYGKATALAESRKPYINR